MKESALVYWTNEKSCGIEPVSHVPANCRFEGSVAVVQYSGDKKWYPAKVVMISGDMRKLKAKEDELAVAIMKEKEENQIELSQEGNRQRSRTRKAVTPGPSVASEREVALALGQKAPVPKQLSKEDKASKKLKAEAKSLKAKGQVVTDESVMDKLLRSLRAPSNDKDTSNRKEDDVSGDDSVNGEDDNFSMSSRKDEDEEDDNDNEDDPVVITEETPSTSKWCGCHSCNLLQKYDDPTYSAFLKDLSEAFNTNDEKQEKRFLKLKPIPDGFKQVELTIGTGIFIALQVKDQLKVDFKDKPSSLVRETLFALYGKNVFQVCNITARGNKSGSHGIHDSVLKAVLSFVNRHVNSDKKLKFTAMVSLINKRAPEWRKVSSSSPKVTEKKKGKKSPSKVTSTVPFKVTRTPVNNAEKGESPQKPFSPRKTPNKSPKKSTPSKSPKRALFSTASSPSKYVPSALSPGTSSSGPQHASCQPAQQPSHQPSSYAPYTPYHYQPSSPYYPSPHSPYAPPHSPSGYQDQYYSQGWPQNDIPQYTQLS